MEQIIKLQSSNFKSDEKQLTFLDSRFYTNEETGDVVPSVTTILQAFPKGYGYHKWLKEHGSESDNILKEAGERGSRVHSLTERLDNGEEINLYTELALGVRLGEWAMLEKYVEFRQKTNWKLLENEMQVIGKDYAGTIDRIFEDDDHNKILVDIKTSNNIWDSYWLQLSAYNKLLTDRDGYNPIDRVAILWLNAKTRTAGKGDAIQGRGWQMISKDDTERDLKLFDATHKVWLAQNANLKPKQATYSLKIKL